MVVIKERRLVEGRQKQEKEGNKKAGFEQEANKKKICPAKNEKEEEEEEEREVVSTFLV